MYIPFKRSKEKCYWWDIGKDNERGFARYRFLSRRRR
jgi:hypothetical protein